MAEISINDSYLEELDDFDRLYTEKSGSDSIHIDKIADAEMHKKTHALAPQYIKSLDLSPSTFFNFKEKTIDAIPEGMPIASLVEGVAQNNGMPIAVRPVEIKAPVAGEESENYAWQAVRDVPEKAWPVIENGLVEAAKGEAPSLEGFPNLARESVSLGVAKEKVNRDALRGHVKEAKQYQKNIDLLLDLKAEISTGSSEKDCPLSDKAKEIIQELKANGIDIWKGDPNTVPKDKHASLGSDITGRADQERVKLQTLFTTVIQVIIQSDSSIMQALQNIVRENSNFLRDVTGRYATR